MEKAIEIGAAVAAAPVVAAAGAEAVSAASSAGIAEGIATIAEKVEGNAAGQFAVGFAKGFASSGQPGMRVKGVTIAETAGIWAGKGAGWAVKNPEKVAAFIYRVRELLP